MKYEICYFKANSGKYYTTDVVEWPTDAPDHSGYNPISSFHRIKDMHAVCMDAPQGFPQFSPAQFEGVMSPVYPTGEEAEAWWSGYCEGRNTESADVGSYVEILVGANTGKRGWIRSRIPGALNHFDVWLGARGVAYSLEELRVVEHAAPNASAAKRMHTDPSEWLPCKDGLRHHVDCGMFAGVACSCVPREMNPGATPLNDFAAGPSSSANSDAERLRLVLSYAGSDAGRAAASMFLAELSRLRTIEAAARDASTVALNDAGPEGHETMAALRASLRAASPFTRPADQETKR